MVTKTLLIHKALIYLILRRQLKKIIPNWWKVDEINVMTIEKKHYYKGYEVYVKVKSKVEKDIWTNDFVVVDYLGRIKSHTLSRSIRIYDEINELEVKKWNRDNQLSKILN